MAGEFTRARQARTDHLSKILEISEKLAEQPARRKEYKVREQAAERKIKLAPKLEKAEELKVDDIVGGLEQSIDDRAMEGIAQSVGDINSKEVYDIEYKKLPKEFKQSMELTGNWEKDQGKLKYFTEKTMHNIDQRRAIEMEMYKGLTKATGKAAPYTKPAGPQYFDVNLDMAGIKAQLSQHPQFKTMAKGILGTQVGADVFASPEIMTITTQMANEANSLMYDSYNKAVAGRSHYVINQKEAMNLAVEKQLALMHNSNPATKTLDYLSPEEAEVQKQQWISTQGQELAGQVEGFNTLPPQRKMLYLNKMYEDYQMHSYLLKKEKGSERTLYGD